MPLIGQTQKQCNQHPKQVKLENKKLCKMKSHHTEDLCHHALTEKEYNTYIQHNQNKKIIKYIKA